MNKNKFVILYREIEAMINNWGKLNLSKEELENLSKCLVLIKSQLKLAMVEQHIFDNKRLKADIQDTINRLKETEKQLYEEKGGIEFERMAGVTKQERANKRKLDKLKENRSNIKRAKELQEEKERLEGLLKKSDDSRQFINAICQEELANKELYQTLVDTCASCFINEMKSETFENRPLFKDDKAGFNLDNTNKIFLSGYEIDLEAVNGFMNLVQDPEKLRELYEYVIIDEELMNEQQRLEKVQADLDDINKVEDIFIEPALEKVDNNIQELIHLINDYIDLQKDKKKQGENLSTKDNKLVRVFNTIFRRDTIEKNDGRKLKVIDSNIKYEIENQIKSMNFDKIDSPDYYAPIYKVYENLAKDYCKKKSEKDMFNYKKSKADFLDIMNVASFDQKILEIMPVELMHVLNYAYAQEIKSTDIKRYIIDKQKDKQKSLDSIELLTQKRNNKWKSISKEAKDTIQDGRYNREEILRMGHKYLAKNRGYYKSSENKQFSYYTALTILNVLMKCKNIEFSTPENMRRFMISYSPTIKNIEFGKSYRELTKIIEDSLSLVNGELVQGVETQKVI